MDDNVPIYQVTDYLGTVPCEHRLECKMKIVFQYNKKKF